MRIDQRKSRYVALQDVFPSLTHFKPTSQPSICMAHQRERERGFGSIDEMLTSMHLKPNPCQWINEWAFTHGGMNDRMNENRSIDWLRMDGGWWTTTTITTAEMPGVKYSRRKKPSKKESSLFPLFFYRTFPLSGHIHISIERMCVIGRSRHSLSLLSRALSWFLRPSSPLFFDQWIERVLHLFSLPFRFQARRKMGLPLEMISPKKIRSPRGTIILVIWMGHWILKGIRVTCWIDIVSHSMRQASTCRNRGPYEEAIGKKGEFVL